MFEVLYNAIPSVPIEVPTPPFLTCNTFSLKVRGHISKPLKNCKTVSVFCKVDKMMKAFELNNDKNIFTHQSH
jgi:hypothetical protein